MAKIRQPAAGLKAGEGEVMAKSAVIEPAPKLQDIEVKVSAGQELTDQEKLEIMSQPNDATEETGNEDTPPQKKEASAEPAPKEKADTPESKSQEDKDAETQSLLEAELDKPAGTEDLTRFNQKELALFHRMRKEQRRNQRLQQENELLKFKELQRIANTKDPETPKVEATDLDKELQGIEDDDILTAGQAKKLIAALRKEQAKPVENKGIDKTLPKIWNLEARQYLQSKGITDFDQVIVYAESVLTGDKEAEEEVKASFQEGNPALTTYYLLKAHPKWPEIEKAIKARTNPKPVEDPNLRRMKDNEQKPVTTGGAGGSGGDGDSDLSLPEVLNQWDTLTPKERSHYFNKFNGKI